MPPKANSQSQLILYTASLRNPEDPIIIPVVSSQVDYEGELGVVIGRSCKNVLESDALDYVLGCMCANHISARDWQKDLGGGQFCQVKSSDTFCPLGPSIVTKKDIPNPNDLRIRTILNGEIVQDGHTNQMIFSVPYLISFPSKGKTLLPGAIPKRFSGTIHSHKRNQKCRPQFRGLPSSGRATYCGPNNEDA
jgi:2-keto-4-pentenoate hydratase/2-oxohepta-3-ene-1,7-dioic acid hydratase in catechol pathway